MRFEFPATWPAPILATASPRVPLNAPRPGWGEGVTFAARRGREVAHSQATTSLSKISKPNRFAYPSRSRPRGVRKERGRSPILDLAPAKTSSYRDTANLGFGVTPRPGRDSDYFGSGVAHCRRKPYEWCRVLLATRRASNVATMWFTSSVSKSIRIGAATRMAAPLPLAVRSTSTT